MSTELIKAYCEKPHSFLKDVLDALGIIKYEYKLPEIEKIVSELKGGCSALESQFGKKDVFVKKEFDMFNNKVVDGAYMYLRDNTTVIQLRWDNPERIDAEVWFDKTHNHPPEEYTGLKKVMREHDFHILKQKD